MRAWRKILCPVDFSDESRSVALHAVELAWAFDGEVTLLHVWDVPAATRGTGDVPVLYEGATPSFEHVAPELRARLAGWTRELGEGVGGDVVHGSPAEEILRYATDRGFDLVVMGTHGRSGLRLVLLGSVAEKVIRGSQIPVVVIRQP